MLTRRNALFLVGGGAVAFAALPHAASAEEKVFVTKGVAINGYDPVGYFTEARPVKGDPAHQSQWMGATWQFASAENKATFDADPEAYAPKYGGYCAYAVANGYTASTDPDAWTVYENRLYLNYSRRVRRTWERDIPGNIAKGDANWPSVLG